MRCTLRSGIFHGTAIAAIAIAASVTPASATRCLYPGDSAVGGVRSEITAAWRAAMASWERTVAKRHGRRFADWNYAADGKVDCTWNDRGNRIRCVARAVACAE